jgi:hypothetical protein
VYLHILKWDRDQLKLPPLKARIIKGKALTGGNVRIEQTGEATIIRMPVREQNTVNTVVKVEMEAPVPSH